MNSKDYLSFLVSTQFKMLASFEGNLFSVLALCTFHTKNNFLGCFRLNEYRNCNQCPELVQQHLGNERNCAQFSSDMSLRLQHLVTT